MIRRAGGSGLAVPSYHSLVLPSVHPNEAHYLLLEVKRKWPWSVEKKVLFLASPGFLAPIHEAGSRH